MTEFDRLVDAARSVVAPRQLTDSATCGTVGAALETTSGEVFVGVCVDTASSLGFCAEHAAAAAMLTAGQSTVVRMVAVDRHGAVLAPCGRCREFVSQLDVANGDTLVMVDASTTIALRELLPFRW
ncbi:cytidine deaminase [Mycobacteroides abscessus subsp. massiliense]|uniref:cytidine deaminase family protein n=1 Tax=Mycobacteroides abscessus TaxID=36809 RepID=UPI0009A72DC1|nr:cytidine deaminase [Mycobacteroides abscessus]SKK91178.1 cytidine deaminase [Mycobacteroides abscessus subsp. massiliense]